MSKNKIKVNEISSSTDEGTKLIKIILIIGVIFAIVYFATGYVSKYMNKKNSNQNETDAAAVIQYDEIMIGEILNQKPEEYYVLVIKEDDPYSSLYQSLLTTYKNKEGHLNVYTASLSSGFNQKYIGEEENLKPEQITQFKTKGKVLLKVKDKKITDSYTEDAILTQLKEMAK